ncbi:MAG: M48 family metalloprotease [Pseudomonadota bacterium]
MLIAIGIVVPLRFSYAAPVFHPRDHVPFYIDSYGEVFPHNNPQVARAHDVFARVKAVADKSAKRSQPRLVVVNSPGDPWAIALPDGHVVLSRSAVELCHEDATIDDAEARLAFILGHELAHMASDDFLHKEVFQFLAKQEKAPKLRAEHANGTELAADASGFIYASMAGFSVERLLEASGNAPDFLHFWSQQTSDHAPDTHPEVHHRASLLRQHLQNVYEQLGLFHFGVRLSHFDYCDDAVHFFREFQKSFPGREVLNNLGFCQLQIALQLMDATKVFQYWMPLLLDGETRAGTTLVQRGGNSLKTLSQAEKGQAEGFLRNAVAYLDDARDADPYYIPARINLAVALLYLGKPHHSRAVISEARGLAPDDIAIKELEALVLYEQSNDEIDYWPMAVAKLEMLTQNSDEPRTSLFNLARLLEGRGRGLEARKYWNKLVAYADQMPSPIRNIVCHQQTKVSPDACLQKSVSLERNPPWQWPLPASGFHRLSPEMWNDKLKNWNSLSFDWLGGDLHGHIFRSPDSDAEILELDQFIQMQVIKGEGLGSRQALDSYCGQTMRSRVLSRGTLWSCNDWAALTIGADVREIWWIAQ